MSTQTNGQNSVRQPRGSYRLPVERRAVVAAGWVREHNWTQRQAAGLCCVNAGYVSLVQRLSDQDRLRLARGELKLSHLWKKYRYDLAERRAQRLAAEMAAQAQAKREEQVRVIQACLDRVSFQYLFEEIVRRWDFTVPVEVLDILARRANRDFVEIVIDRLGSDRVLDRLTAPQRVAAE